MFCIFDLDGTLADITHRTHFVRGTRKPDWDSFFAACEDDMPVHHVIAALDAHLMKGHRVEIWSGRSDVVRDKTEWWLQEWGIDPALLRHMRAAGDNTPDVELKRYWLNQEAERPDLVYDDRPRVIQMWRSEGIPCFQVTADWEDEGRQIAPVCDPLLTIMVGPSGAGKTREADRLEAELNVYSGAVLSSDWLRSEYTGDFRSQERNDDVFTALHRIAKARLSCGLPVIIDATNLRRRDRLACVALAPAGVGVRYVVVDRPLAEKVRDGGWRNDVIMRDGKTLIEVHHERMQSVLREVLAGDGLSNVTVVDLRKTEERMVAA